MILSLLFAGCASTSGGSGIGYDKEGGTSETSENTPADADGDGVSDADEAAAGTDPALADSDGDALEDGAEADAGTDPLDADSDNDGYRDGDEVATGHDPTDKKDGIYEGGWPYNAAKDDMETGAWSEVASEGSLLPRFKSYDQFGEDFDAYDYALQGKPIIIDVSAGWCYYCQEMAKLVAGQNSYFDAYTGSLPALGKIKDAVDDGSVLWIEVLDQTDQSTKINEDFLALWDSAFPNENVAVVADEKQQFVSWLQLTGYPTLFALDENMEVQSLDPNDYTAPIKWAVNHAK